jgi:hypothetical protein
VPIYRPLVAGPGPVWSTDIPFILVTASYDRRELLDRVDRTAPGQIVRRL